MSDIPRRARIDLLTPAERAIRDAVLEVEAAGCDERLTRAVTLLADAQAWVADFVDGVDPKDHYPRAVETRCECGHLAAWHDGPCVVGPPCECERFVASSAVPAVPPPTLAAIEGLVDDLYRAALDFAEDDTLSCDIDATRAAILDAVRRLVPGAPARERP